MSAPCEAWLVERDAPIIVFDSGVGGLSVLQSIRAALPRAPLVYAMDRAAYPYGQQAEATLLARVPALLGRLAERYRPRLIVMACNTASTVALAAVREALQIPIVGTVPAIKPAAAITQTGVIGVLGTAATVRQAYVDRLTAAFAADRIVLRHGAPALVDYAEARLRGAPGDPDAPFAAINALLTQPDGDRLDTVVLACTHFPLVGDALAEAAPRQLRFIHGAEGIARRCQALTTGQLWPDHASLGTTLTTGDPAACAPLAETLARFGLGAARAL
tara:strand:- start:752 stop:1576 length:825 start_codon:yes stop_codon:yes gene_type:complete